MIDFLVYCVVIPALFIWFVIAVACGKIGPLITGDLELHGCKRVGVTLMSGAPHQFYDVTACDGEILVLTAPPPERALPGKGEDL